MTGTESGIPFLSWGTLERAGLSAVAASLGLAAYYYGSRVLGFVIRELVMELDRSVIGADVVLKAVGVQPLKGRVVLHELEVGNPEGYKSEYLLRAKRITLDVNLMRLFKSLGRDVEIEELEMREVDAVVEFAGLVAGESNVHKVLAHLGEPQEEGHFSSARQQVPPIFVRAFWSFLRLLRTRRELVLRKVSIVDIGARISTRMAGVRAACADIRHDDYSKQAGAMKASRLFAAVLESVLKSVVANVGGKSLADWAL
mmetsp:Transcript_1035/g.3523  ORF Transcript_1035/g.3523 Transcript_1035/m.3523 type:complete len:257 (+) Transcript_1035:80-850(+)